MKLLNLKILLIATILILSGCKGSAGSKFSFLDTNSTDGQEPVSVSISSFSPPTDPVTLASTSKTTFTISLAATDSTVSYNFILDNTTTLQNGKDPFYVLDASTLTAGSHTLKVTASNSKSSDTHTFNIIINRPTVITSFTPSLTGTNVSCGSGTQNFTAAYSEVDTSDTVQIKWYLNNNLVSGSNSNMNITNDPANSIALSNFHPDCTLSGINFIRMDLNDGHEITSQTWTVYVDTPTSIHITDSTPTTNPVVITSNSTTTFGVTLQIPDPSANYQFILDSLTTLQNDHRTYYTINGNALAAGNHTLKVLASNSSSSDFKIFNIRKNTPPSATGYSPAFSNNSIACGTTPTTFYADWIDVNGDALTYTWSLDDTVSAYITASNTASRGQMSFVPNCSLTGSHTIKLVASDGYESTTLSWSVNITSPINIQISSFLPATNPTIMTANTTTTFAVALTTSDSNVIYSFVLKNLATNISQTLQSGSVPFYNLYANSVAAGNYELKVTASNGSSSDTHTFSIRKNSPPAVPPTPLTFSPALTGTVLDCGSSSQLFTSPISDADSDIMAVTWYLNGSSTAANLVSTSNQTTARATYTPSCSEVGVQTISVGVYDGYETTTKTWTVQVINPTVVSINNYSPGTDPIYMLSSGSQTFSISATGKAPVTYEWKLDGNVLSSATDNYYVMNASSLTTGVHTLIAKAIDSTSSDTHTFNIIKNAAPVISGVTPSTSSNKINVNTVLNLSGTFTDANGDAMTVTWKLNNTTVTASNPYAAVTTIGSTSTLTLTPQPTILGQNTIQLIINDGHESTTQTWTVTVNYFSDICNNMAAGRVCTLLGKIGLGSNINVNTNPEKVKIQPAHLAADASGNLFFSDPVTHTVWFYNRTASPITLLGQTVGANKIMTMLGTGVPGTGINNSMYNDFAISTPRGLYWNGTQLFVADEGNSRVVRVNADGTVNIVMGGGTNTSAGNTDGGAYNTTYCASPRDLEYDSATSRLYVSCYGSGTIKYMNISNSDYTTWTGYTLLGKATAGVTANNARTDGTIGLAGAGQTFQPNQLRIDTANNVLYFTETGTCTVRAVNLSASTQTWWGGAVTITSNNVGTLIGSTCTTYAEGPVATHRFLGNIMGLELRRNGTTLEGLYLSDYNNQHVIFANNTASSITIGNAAVPSYNTKTIWGNGVAAYYMPCNYASSSTCYVYTPSELLLIGNKLYLADYNNFRIRSLVVGTPASPVTNGTVADVLGFDSKAGFAGNGGTSAESVQWYNPLNLYYDTTGSKLIVTDYTNRRFRSVNLSTGRVDAYIGAGSGSANTTNQDPTLVLTQGPRQVLNYTYSNVSYMLYSDQNTSNCLVRAWNTSASNQSMFGVNINSNAVQTIAGNFINGCGAWNSSAVTSTDSNVILYHPDGITTDGSNLYIANTYAHCILKVTSTGSISVLSGSCGSTGAANTGVMAYNSSSVRFSYPTQLIVDPRQPYYSAGNLFIVDQNNNTNVATKIRYLNQSSSQVTIFGVDVPAGEIKTVFATPDSFGEGIAIYDNVMCVSTGGSTLNGTSTNNNNNVLCFKIDDSTGTITWRIGRNPGAWVSKGAIQQDAEEEGLPYTQVSLAGPSGLAFDTDGNLYIAEKYGHTIRMVKKWW